MSDAERLAELRPEAAEARRVVAYALFLRQYGERAPGGNETWAEWDRMAEAHVRATGWEPGERPPGAAVSVEVRWRCDACHAPSGTFHKGCPGTFVRVRRVVTTTAWEPAPDPAPALTPPLEPCAFTLAREARKANA